MRIGYLIAGAAVAAAFATPASAQRGRYYYYDEPAYAPYSRAAPAPRYCQRLCDRDFSPCDPIQFKLADGRCAGVNTGGRW